VDPGIHHIGQHRYGKAIHNCDITLSVDPVGFVVEELTVTEDSIIWAATSLVFNTALTGAMVVKLLSVALYVFVCI
jgi:hypothetical protein